MKKMVYEKPLMLVEGFVPTQSVAANCGTNVVDLDPIELGIDSNGVGTHICDQTTCGHNVNTSLLEKWTNPDDSGFKDINNNKTISLFNSGECELVYESFIDPNGKKNNPVQELGAYLLGNGSWNSDTHRMKINGIKVPS